MSEGGGLILLCDKMEFYTQVSTRNPQQLCTLEFSTKRTTTLQKIRNINSNPTSFSATSYSGSGGRCVISWHFRCNTCPCAAHLPRSTPQNSFNGGGGGGGFANAFRDKKVAMDDSLATDDFEATYHTLDILRYQNISSAWKALQTKEVDAIAYDTAEVAFILSSIEGDDPDNDSESIARWYGIQRKAPIWAPASDQTCDANKNEGREGNINIEVQSKIGGDATMTLRSLLFSTSSGDLSPSSVKDYDDKPVVLSDPFFPISYSLAGCRNHSNSMHKDVSNLRYLCLNDFNVALSAMYTGRQFSRIRQKWLTVFDGGGGQGSDNKGSGR